MVVESMSPELIVLIGVTALMVCWLIVVAIGMRHMNKRFKEMAERHDRHYKEAQARILDHGRFR
jgi:hypothetical protein